MSESMTLYALTDEYRALMDLAADPEADPESFDGALQNIQGDITDKAIAVASVARNLEAFAGQIDAAVADMTVRAQSARNRAARVRAYLLGGLESAEISKIESPYFVVSIKKNPPAVEISDDADIPPDLCRVIPATTKPDRAAIKKALQAGEAVDGCRLVQSKRLDIK